MKIAVLGVGALAIALTKVIEGKNHDIVMWGKYFEECDMLRAKRENERMFPGVKISDRVKVTSDIKEAVEGANIILNVLPFIAVRDTAELLKGIYNKEQIICSTTKGIDEETFIPTTSIFEEVLGAEKMVALSGPSFAIEIANMENISFMLGGKSKEAVTMIKELFDIKSIKIEVTEDIVGIQIAGGVKNAIAIGAGMLTGLKAADSTKAAYLALGINDISKIIVMLGGKSETAYSYAGVGDLILTCMSPTSRNFTFGEYLGNYLTVKEAFEKMNNKTVEGYKVIRALHKYSVEKNVKLDTIPTLYKIVFENEKVDTIKEI